MRNLITGNYCGALRRPLLSTFADVCENGKNKLSLRQLLSIVLPSNVWKNYITNFLNAVKAMRGKQVEL
jgi:hypothetical protein